MYYLYIDIVDACNLSCASCPRGLGIMKKSKRKMNFNLFKSIIDKACSENEFGTVDLFNWTEPFLHEDIHNFYKYAKSKGYNTRISTNLSLKHIPNFIETLKSIDDLYVSISGFTQKTHEINHSGSNIETVKKHLYTIFEAKNKNIIKSNVYVRYLDFNYNNNEVEMMRNFISQFGFIFQHDATLGDPKRKIPMDFLANYDSQLNLNKTNEPCGAIFEHLALDCNGDVYLCCHTRNIYETRICNFLELPIEKIQEKRQKNKLCKRCGFYYNKDKGEIFGSKKEYIAETAHKTNDVNYICNVENYIYKNTKNKIVYMLAKHLKLYKSKIFYVLFFHYSTYFDNVYYIMNNNDVFMSGIDPIRHYVFYGAQEGRNPNAWFNTMRYLEKNPDVAENGINPFYHYLCYGIREGRKL